MQSSQRTDPFDLSGRTAIVTGAGSGIGRAIAWGLGDRGAAVVAVDISQPAAADTASRINDRNGDSLALTADVRSASDVESVARAAVDRFGSVDILVNNVGGNVGAGGPVERLPLNEWTQTLELTVTTAFLCAKHIGGGMIARGGGRIINVASIYGLVGHDASLYDPTVDGDRPEQIAYIAAKGAVIAFTRGLAAYWARYHINVNALAPGMVRTPANDRRTPDHWRRLVARTPLGRIAGPEDLAGAAVFLASPASSHITGQTIAVDGGWTIL
jgi:gluconate 5-dehydrogenase